MNGVIMVRLRLIQGNYIFISYWEVNVQDTSSAVYLRPIESRSPLRRPTLWSLRANFYLCLIRITVCDCWVPFQSVTFDVTIEWLMQMGSRPRAQSPSSVNKTSQWQLACVLCIAHPTRSSGIKGVSFSAFRFGAVSPLSCVSCPPASCVHIWLVSCPCQMWLSVNSCPAVCLWLCVNYPVYLVPVFWVRFRLVYSLLPVFPVCQPCLVLPCPH